MSRRPGQLHVILNEDAVVEGGDAGWAQEFAGGVETRSVKNDVVNLPLAGRARGVYLRGKLAVDSGGLAVGVCLVFVGVEDLHFVEAVEENAAVSAVLVLALRGQRLAELDMELAIAEGFARVEVAGFRDDLEICVFYFPLGRAAIFMLPLGEIFAVEEDDGVGGRTARNFWRACGAGIDDGRDRTVGVVDWVFGVDLSLGEREKNEGEKREAYNRGSFFHWHTSLNEFSWSLESDRKSGGKTAALQSYAPARMRMP